MTDETMDRTGFRMESSPGEELPGGGSAGVAARSRAARRGLGLYVGILTALSLPLYVVIAARGLPVAQQPALITLLMWAPAIAAVATRLLRREGLKGTGLGVLGGAAIRQLLIALAFPVVVGAISYGAAWGVGLASFAPAGGAGATAGLAGLQSLTRSIGRALLIGTPLGILMVVGEEIGWRGYMSDRLREAGLPLPGLIGGLIWTAWHAPLILTGQYAAGPHALLAVLGFALLAVGLHLLWSAWKQRTGSLWPAVIGHSAWNAVIGHSFDGHTTGQWASLWLGDSGLLTAGLCLVVALLLVTWRGTGGPGGRRRRPPADPANTAPR